MPSTNLFVAHEQAIIAACAQHEQTHRQLLNYWRCIPFSVHTTNYLVKFGDSWCFSFEATMQREFAGVAQRDPSARACP